MEFSYFNEQAKVPINQFKFQQWGSFTLHAKLFIKSYLIKYF